MTLLRLAYPSLVRACLAVAVAAALGLPLVAQQPRTLTIIMVDGKTGKPIIPSNLIVRFDYLNEVHNTSTAIDDEGVARVLIPDNAKFISVQGTFNNSMDIYVNCDAAMEKDITTRHWYPVADIQSTGVVMPNECYKGKYAEATHLNPKPGIFVFYVRKNNWHEFAPE